MYFTFTKDILQPFALLFLVTALLIASLCANGGSAAGGCSSGRSPSPLSC